MAKRRQPIYSWEYVISSGGAGGVTRAGKVTAAVFALLALLADDGEESVADRYTRDGPPGRDGGEAADCVGR